MRLFHSPGSRSDRVLWICEEMGVPVELVPAIPRQPTEEMLALYPSGSLPVLQLDDGKVIGESVAALLYLARKYSPQGLAVDPTDPGYSDYLQFTVFGEAAISAPMSGIVMTHLRTPERGGNFTTKAIAEGIALRLKVVQRRLATGVEFLAADRFTAADICVAAALVPAQRFILDYIPRELLDYCARMRERPAYQRVRALHPEESMVEKILKKAP